MWSPVVKAPSQRQACAPLVLSSVFASGEQVLFNPVMATDGGCGLSVAGSGAFRLLRAADGALKAAPCALAKREPQNYTAHAWLPDSAPS